MYMHIMYVCVIVLPVGRLIFDMALVAEDKKLYYADFNEKTIVVLSLDTHKNTILVSVNGPTGFAVDRKMG